MVFFALFLYGFCTFPAVIYERINGHKWPQKCENMHLHQNPMQMHCKQNYSKSKSKIKRIYIIVL